MNIDDLIKKFNEGKDLSYEEIESLLVMHKERNNVISEVVNILKNIDHDWCMCGSKIDGNNAHDNHIPISTFDYYYPKVIELLERIRKK